jgi:hypothetical protein
MDQHILSTVLILSLDGERHECRCYSMWRVWCGIYIRNVSVLFVAVTVDLLWKSKAARFHGMSRGYGKFRKRQLLVCKWKTGNGKWRLEVRGWLMVDGGGHWRWTLLAGENVMSPTPAEMHLESAQHPITHPLTGHA